MTTSHLELDSGSAQLALAVHHDLDSARLHHHLGPNLAPVSLRQCLERDGMSILR
jgi:hypothetical protein